MLLLISSLSCESYFSVFILSLMDIAIYISFVGLCVIIILLYVNLFQKRRLRNIANELQLHTNNLDLAIRAGKIEVWGYDVKSDRLYNIVGNAIPKPNSVLSDGLELVHPDDHEGFIAAFTKVLQGELPKTPVRIRMIKSTGNTCWEHIEKEFTVIKNKDGVVTTVIGTHRDVTSEVEEKNRINDLNKKLQSSNDKINYILHFSEIRSWEYIIDKKMIITSYGSNDEFSRYTRSEYIQNVALSDLNETNTIFDAMEARELDTFNSQISVYQGEGVNKELRYIQLNGAPVRDEGGKVIAYTGLRRDITETVLMQTKLERERKKALQADKLKSAFLANMSHEIRTPLNAIVGFSELLQTVEDKEEKAEYMKIINANNEQLLRLIGDVLDLSKIESGMLELKESEFSIRDLFCDLYESFKQRIHSSAISFIFEKPLDDFLVYTDQNRLTQIVTNYLTNAIKYTRQGHIKIGYEIKDSGVSVYVKDTGIGIDKDDHNQVFGRFQKFDNFAQGTGLGLAICKAIIRSVDGKIGFSSEKDKGSLFWAWIPCPIRLSSSQEIDERQNIDDIEKEEVTLRPLTMLITEDNDSNFGFISTLLKGHNVVRAINGLEAVEMATKRDFDVILMDINMPAMNGLEATRKIREFNSEIPIIIVTANAYDSDKELSEEAGCSGFITKPINIKLLMKMLSTIEPK